MRGRILSESSFYYIEKEDREFARSKPLIKNSLESEIFSREEIEKRLFSSDPFVGTEEEYIDYLFGKGSYIGSLAKRIIISSNEEESSLLSFIRMMKNWGIRNLNKVLLALEEKSYFPSDYYYLRNNSSRKRIFNRIIEGYSIEDYNFKNFLFAVFMITANKNLVKTLCKYEKTYTKLAENRGGQIHDSTAIWGIYPITLKNLLLNYEEDFLEKIFAKIDLLNQKLPRDLFFKHWGETAEYFLSDLTKEKAYYLNLHYEIKIFFARTLGSLAKNICLSGRYYKILDKHRDKLPLILSDKRNYKFEFNLSVKLKFRLSCLPKKGDTLENIFSHDFFLNRGNKNKIHFISKTMKWVESYGRIPQNKIVVSTIPADLVSQIRIKPLSILLDKANQNGYQYHSVISLIRLYCVWGDRVNQIISRSRSEQMIHDLGINLSEDVIMHLRKYPHLSEKMWKAKDTLSIYNRWIAVLNNIPFLERRGVIDEKNTLLDYEKIIAETEYDARIPELAVECKRWNISPKLYPNIEDFYIRYTSKKTAEAIPYASVEIDGYRMYKLSYDDPRALFLGDYTYCCQKIGGLGESCVKHGLSSPKGAFFVVERFGNVIAQSWAWRKGDCLVFDNIEALSIEYSSRILELYKAISNKLLGLFGIKRIHIGTGHSDVDLSDLPLVEPVETPEGIYTDAREQVLLASL